jgi:hypothetical protein
MGTAGVRATAFGIAMAALALIAGTADAQRGRGPGDAPGAAAAIAADPPFRAQQLVLSDKPIGSAARPLFNGKNLDGWDTWLHTAEVSKILTNTITPIGLNKDETGVFSVVAEDGAPAIRVSGAIVGALMSKAEFGNYHLRLQYKWGRPTNARSRNSGLLYHSHGPLGACFGEWMAGIEFAIQEGQTGSTIPVGASEGATSYADMNWHVGMTVQVGQDAALNYPRRRFMLGGRPVPVVFPAFSVQPSANVEKTEVWNTIELYAYGDQSIHVVNGVPVLHAMQLTTRTTRNGSATPLTRGRLQFESEGAEIFYRDIVIETIDRLPRISVVD